MKPTTFLCLIGRSIVVSMAMVSPALAGWFGPSSYEDCILESMKGITSDKAAKEIKEACTDKVARKPTPAEEAQYARQRQIDAVRPLSSSELAEMKITELDIHPRSGGGYWVDANLYNGNKNLHVCSVTYNYRPAKRQDWSNTHRWVVEKGVAPLATTRVRFETTVEVSKAIQKSGIEYRYLDASGTVSGVEAYVGCR